MDEGQNRVPESTQYRWTLNWGIYDIVPAWLTMHLATISWASLQRMLWGCRVQSEYSADVTRVMASLTGRTLTVQIAERMVFIICNEVHVNCIEPHPSALSSTNLSQKRHNCNPSLSSLESQTRPKNFDIKRSGSGLQEYFCVRTGNLGATRSLSIPIGCTEY